MNAPPSPYSPFDTPGGASVEMQSPSSSSNGYYDPQSFDSLLTDQLHSYTQGGFDPENHTRLAPDNYDPSRFLSSNSFALPRFAKAVPESQVRGYDSSLMPPPPVPMRHQIPHQGDRQAGPPAHSPLLDNPVYDAYGSSVLAVNNPVKPLTKPSGMTIVPSAPSGPFDASVMGLPSPPQKPANFAGLYSSTGLDLLTIFSRVTNRKNPEIQLGPIDLGCSFLVTDPRQPDNPIVYASDTFSALTGYTNAEILGRNCRFLQSPDGIVNPGSKRQYTDGQAVYHLKRFINTGRESQASLINYRKGGEPFINLITVVPVAWDDNSDEIAFFVGFQVNLVDQPNSIVNKMQNGTYIVNYALVGRDIPRSPQLVSDGHDAVEEQWDTNNAVDIEKKDVLAGHEPISESEASDLIDAVKSSLLSFRDDKLRTQFNKLLLDQCEDLVHVVSLKGTLLYVSPSILRLLEYTAEELTGKTLASICHPSDIVAVLRELKESSSSTSNKDEGVNLLYRVRRKHSGYIWLAAHGKLFVESGKARKSIILTGRQEKVYQVSWADLERTGGLTDKEYWVKYSHDGMQLYTTPTVEKVLGYKSEELMGSTVSRIDPTGALTAAIKSVAQAPTPVCTSLDHTLQGKFGPVNVTTNFFPSHAGNADVLASPAFNGHSPELSNHVIAQTAVTAEFSKRRAGVIPAFSRTTSTTSIASHDSSGSAAPVQIAVALPSYRGKGSDDENAVAGNGNSSSSFSAITSTFKTLTTSQSDNIFEELETTRGTSWQFELHQLRLVNRKLREEKVALETLIQRKKRKRAHGQDPVLGMISETTAAAVGAKNKDDRKCANCGRGSSAEWRSGPTGPKTLCNACGLRWSKARSMSATSHATSSSSHVGSSLPSSSTDTGTSSEEWSTPSTPMSFQLPPRVDVFQGHHHHHHFDPHKHQRHQQQQQQQYPRRPSLAGTHQLPFGYSSSSSGGNSGDVSSAGDSYGSM